jgi:hypothetical protein
MKIKLLILTAALLLVFPTVFAQTKKEIASIAKQVNTINRNLKKYTKKKKDVDDISTEGAAATYYVSGRGLMKISARIYGETYNAVASVYYQGEEPIFIYFKLNKYDTQIGLEKPPQVVKFEEKRFYFSGEKLIKLLIGKKQIKSSDERFDDSKDEIVELAQKLKNAYETDL